MRVHRHDSDLDFEYPANAAQGQGFANLYTSLRTALDALAAKKGDATTYQLTVSVLSLVSLKLSFLILGSVLYAYFNRASTSITTMSHA